MPISRKAHSALNFSGLRAVNSRVAACRAAIGSHRPARWPSDHAPSATCPGGMPRMEPLEPALRLLTTTEATSWIEKPTQTGETASPSLAAIRHLPIWQKEGPI